jgi:hypothetical protein
MGALRRPDDPVLEMMGVNDHWTKRAARRSPPLYLLLSPATNQFGFRSDARQNQDVNSQDAALKSSELDNLEEHAVMLNTRVRRIPALARSDTLCHKAPKSSRRWVLGDGYDGRLEEVEEA